MSWLLENAAIPQALIAADSAKHVSVARVPLAACNFLVNAGIRISRTELMSAAGRGIEGVQAWVEAERQCDINSALSELHEAICRADGAVLMVGARPSQVCVAVILHPARATM